MTITRILPLLLVLVLAAGFARADDRIPPQGRQALHKAQMHIDASRFDDAVAVIRAYMAETDEDIHPQIFLMLGGAHYKGGNREKALRAFREGVKAHPGDAQLIRNTGVACYELERYKEAGSLFEKAYGLITPADPVLLYQAGSAYYAGEKYTASAKALGRLIASADKPKEEWVRLAVHAHLNAGQVRQAEKMLYKFLAAHPENAPYWELLAKLQLDREQYAKAAGALEICYLLRDPTQRELERLASLYAYVDAPLMATATLKRAYGTPDSEQRIKIAALSASAGRTDRAVQELSRAGLSAKVAEHKGRILYEARRFEEAESAFRQALKHDPGAAQSRFYLAMCAWERRDWQTAKSNLLKLSGHKTFARRARAPLAVINDLSTARKEALQ